MEEQIKKIALLLNQEGKSAMVIIPNLKKTKKNFLQKYDKLFEKFNKQLIISFKKYLEEQLSIEEKEFLKTKIWFTSDNGVVSEDESLIESLIKSSIILDLDKDNNPYFISKPVTAYIKNEDFNIFFPDPDSICESLNKKWKDVAKISSYKDNQKNIVIIKFDISGLIHAKSTSS